MNAYDYVTARSDDERYYGDSHESSSKTAALEELLASKLAQFLDSSFPYTLNQLTSAAKENLYKGPRTDQKGSGICSILKTESNGILITGLTFVNGLVAFEYNDYITACFTTQSGLVFALEPI